MEENFGLENLTQDDVLEPIKSTSNLTPNAYRISKIQQEIKKIFLKEFAWKLIDLLKQQQIDILPVSGKSIDWLRNAIDCQVLKIGSKGWQKGKVRVKITLEFIADESENTQRESELDDI